MVLLVAALVSLPWMNPLVLLALAAGGGCFAVADRQVRRRQSIAPVIAAWFATQTMIAAALLADGRAGIAGHGHATGDRVLAAAADEALYAAKAAGRDAVRVAPAFALGFAEAAAPRGTAASRATSP